MKHESVYDHRQAIVFVKAPKLGQVKTRLSKHLDVQTVLDIYKCTVADVIETVRQQVDDIKIFYYPAEGIDLVKDWLGRDYEYEPQIGSHLGERMKNAFASSFKRGCSQAILVGTDLPALSANVIVESFKELNQLKAVLGPTYDGGYYLIGFRRDLFIPRVFENMPWGTPRVFGNTLIKFEQANCRVHILPKCRDMDTYDDLIAFGISFNPAKHGGHKTMAYLESLNLV